jgi:hypothetical protein
VAFYEGKTRLGIVELGQDGVATFDASGLPVGTHAIRAVYEGDAYFRAFAAEATTVEVGRNAAAVAAVTTSAPTVYVGRTVSLTATFTVETSASAPLTGGASFYDEAGNLLGVAWLEPGPAALAPDAPTTVVAHATLHGVSMPAGTHMIRVVYEGDANYAPITSTVSATVLVQPVATATALGASTTPAGATVLTANVTAVDPTAPEPAGSVAFYDGDTLLGTVPLVNGVATYEVGALGAGASTFRAVFTSADGTSEGASAGSATVSASGPKVVGLSRHGVHWAPTWLSLAFDSSLDPASAVRASNYRIQGPNGRLIAVSRATYDPAANTVMLYPAQRLNLHRSYTLTVNSRSPEGVAGVTGVALDGSGQGRPGTDFRATVNYRALAALGDRPAMTFENGSARATRSGFNAYVNAVLGRARRVTFAPLAGARLGARLGFRPRN